MKIKLMMSGIGLTILIISSGSIFFYNDNFTLLKVQVPFMMIGGYFMATFLASCIFDRIVIKARSQGLDTVNPYKILIEVLPYLNWFIFGFFGFICGLSLLILLFFA